MKHGTRHQTAWSQLLSERKSALLVALTMLLVAGLTSGAAASTAVLVPPHIEKGVPNDTAEQALEELTRLVRAHGFDVVSPGQAEAAAEDAQKGGGFPSELSLSQCVTPECANEYRKLFDAAFAVQLSLFAESRKVSSVGVVITENSKAYFSGNAQVKADDLLAAVQTAYATAREKHLRGAGPWLSIVGEPAAAAVFMDGAEFGAIPIEKRHVEGGMHRLEVRSDGFATHKQVLNIPARVDHEENVTVSLRPVSAHGPAAERQLDRTWDYVLGGAIAAVGAVHMGAGIYQRTQRDDCAQRTADVCSERYGDDTGVKRDNLLIGTGIAGIAMGGLIMGLAPIARLQIRASRDSASVHVGGTF